MSPPSSTQARLIAAVLAGSAWLSVCSLLFTAAALLDFGAARSGISSALNALIVACGIIAAYVSLRITADRHIFSQLAADDPAALPELDAALLELGWLRHGKAGRSLAERVNAALRLVYILALLLGLQLSAWLISLTS